MTNTTYSASGVVPKAHLRNAHVVRSCDVHSVRVHRTQHRGRLALVAEYLGPPPFDEDEQFVCGSTWFEVLSVSQTPYSWFVTAVEIGEVVSRPETQASIDWLPGPATEGGHVYVLEFNGPDGIVKVGMTGDPKTRMATHAKQAASFGTCITRMWVSAAHLGYEQTEKRLIAAAGAPGSVDIIGKERFFGLDFTRAVEMAKAAVVQTRTAPADMAHV
jgi:hypothetical protein